MDSIENLSGALPVLESELNGDELKASLSSCRRQEVNIDRAIEASVHADLKDEIRSINFDESRPLAMESAASDELKHVKEEPTMKNGGKILYSDIVKNATDDARPLAALKEVALVQNDQENMLTTPQADIQPPPAPIVEKSADARKDEDYLALLSHYLLCVRNKEAHAKFLEDAVVGPFLSLCLASNSDKVVVAVLKIINALLKNRDNYLRLKELLHFTDALQAASRNERLHIAIRNKASAFYEAISNAKKPLGNSLDSSNSAEASIEIGKPLAVVRDVHLYINHTLQKARRVIITRELVKVEGVISVAYNPEQQLCVVRARRVRPEVLGTAIANLGLECYLIAKNEKKEVIRIPMKSDSSSGGCNDENKQEPFYFPEDDEVIPADNAVAKKGFNDAENGESWWNSAKKLARKSLFW